jgi:predicted amidohydrolase YtcJ
MHFLEHPNVQHFFLPGQSLSTLQSSWNNIGGQPIFEIKQTTHKNPVNKKALHPYGKKRNPNNPVNRKEWDKDRPAINKERLKRLEKQRVW